MPPLEPEEPPELEDDPLELPELDDEPLEPPLDEDELLDEDEDELDELPLHFFLQPPFLSSSSSFFLL